MVLYVGEKKDTKKSKKEKTLPHASHVYCVLTVQIISTTSLLTADTCQKVSGLFVGQSLSLRQSWTRGNVSLEMGFIWLKMKQLLAN